MIALRDVGGQDHHVRVLDAAGKEIWKRKLGFYRRPPYVNVMRTVDIDGDGKDEIVAGSLSHGVYCFGPDAKRRWRADLTAPITALAATTPPPTIHTATAQPPMIHAATATGRLSGPR